MTQLTVRELLPQAGAPAGDRPGSTWAQRPGPFTTLPVNRTPAGGTAPALGQTWVPVPTPPTTSWELGPLASLL